ncbi:Pol polyprotein [Plakobranchus ocellatus]|uniref:Pol polyprotein n=1 Tax=Plakobranchus ocellatus TaxID=259542 RepID=A0AAV4BBD3_9GAST|nr:Pol polyprotein [Plakobranchus ocellatus]
MPPPEDKKGVERFLGTVNYMAKFIPNLSTISEPIRKLLKKDNQFVWEHEQAKAFEEIKNALTSEKTLGYFNPNEKITLECDSSQFGLGAMVTQKGKPIAYASRSLSEAESRYAQIEKELLAVVFGLERFENLTYGQHVTVLSDHKPLEAILNKPICLSPPRLQRMLIRLHKFDITLNYKEGKNMFISDMLSRAYLKEKNVVDEQIEKDIHLYVNQIRDSWNVKDYKLKQIEAETSRDIDLQDLKKQILEGFPAKRNNLRRNLHEFFTNSEELSIQGDLILKGTKIIIPQTMRNEMLQILHSSYAGIEKSKQRARESIYWPRINKDIEDYVNRCSTCQTHRNSKQKEPLLPVEVPQLPWNTVGLDVFTLKGHDYLLCVDYYSKYPEVTKLFTKTAHGIITALKPIFARHAKARQELQSRQQKQKVFFDRYAKPCKQNFKKGDKVRVQLKDKWIEGRIHDKHQTRSYWINTDSDQAMYRRNTRFIRHDKSPPAAPAQGNSDSYNPVHSDNDKINPNNHLNKDKLTQSKHSGSLPSHDLLQSHSSAGTQKADIQTCRDSPPIQNSHYKTKCGRSIRPPPKLTL